MEHEQVEKVLGLDGSDSVFFAFGMAIAEGDHAVLALHNILLADDAPVQITAKIDKGLLAVTRVLAINHPLFGATRRNRQLVFDQVLEEFRPEHRGQSLVAEEIIPGFLFPQPCFAVDACCRHDHMDVGMKVQGSGMGVEVGGEPR